MKGTLFSADFIKDENNNLRLLEINTDTGFISSSYSNMDLSELYTLLTDNNINEVHIIYKEFQSQFVDFISESISQNSTNVNSIVGHFEEITSIYPTSVDDSETKFILRLAYDESALFDSTYTKNNLELHKLYIDNSNTNSVPELYYSSSEFIYDTLGIDTINTSSNLPDITLKNISTNFNTPLDFYKIGNITETDENRLIEVKSTLGSSDSVIQKYYNTVNTNKVQSIRSYNIIYGANLDVINIANYTVDSILEIPSTLDINESELLNRLDTKHYFELTTNDLKSVAGGVLEGTSILDGSDNPVLIENLQIGNVYKSFVVGESPNTDDEKVVREWSYTGSELPSGSYVTSSVLVNSTEIDLKYNTVSNISVSGYDGDSIKISPYLFMLTYDIQNDMICYRTPYEITPATHKLFDINNNLVELDDVSINVLEGDNTTYILDMEETDTFFIQGSNVQIKLLTHNCFLEGTEIALANGDTKNIEDISSGEEVLTYNEKTKELESGMVGELKKTNATNIVKVHFENGDLINTTKMHPFFIKGKDWVPAKELRQGDVCRKKDGSEVAISSIEVIDGEFTVYNLIGVTPAHTFYANDILVHNKCFDFNSPVEMWDGSFKKIGEVKVGDVVTSLKDGKRVRGVVTDKLIHPTNDVVPVVEYKNMIADPNHPFLFNNNWVDISELTDSTSTYKFIDNFYNLEIDGKDVETSEHNFIIEGVVVSGLGDNQILNSLFVRQNANLLKNVI